MNPFRVGDVIHGFAFGAFGRDSYNCRRVEAIGADWVVTRNNRGGVEMVAGERIPTREEADCRDWCYMSCVGEMA